MPQKMPKVELTQSAEQDLEGILEYGIQQFGIPAAIQYYDDLVLQFDELLLSPKRFPLRDQIREGYRVCIHRSHDIYFKETECGILIVRILNRQNIEKAINRAFSDI